MTQTRHGHKIPGSPDYDDSETVSKARCGGVLVCAVCKHEAEFYINGRDHSNMKMSAEARGDGYLTAGEAMHQLIGVPPEALVFIQTDAEGEAWSITAEWERPDERPHIPDGPQVRHTPYFETAEIVIGTSGVVRQVQVPMGSDLGFAPKPATDAIDIPQQVNNWQNPYKGQFGDH